MPRRHFSLHFEVFRIEAFISNSVLFCVCNTKRNVSVIFNLASVPIPREERKLNGSVTSLMRSKTRYWNFGRERVGVVQGSLCISLISDGANIMKSCAACCKQRKDQNSSMLLISLSWSYFPLIFVIIRVRWTPSRLYGMLPIFIALNKINCSNKLGFMAIASQFSYICIFIVAVPRPSETTNRLKCLMNSLKCQPAKVFDCLIAKDNWISLSEPIPIVRWTITRAGGGLAVAFALHLRSLQICQCNFPFHELLQLRLNSSYLKVKFTKGVNSLSSFLPFHPSVPLPQR